SHPTPVRARAHWLCLFLRETSAEQWDHSNLGRSSDLGGYAARLRPRPIVWRDVKSYNQRPEVRPGVTTNVSRPRTILGPDTRTIESLSGSAPELRPQKAPERKSRRSPSAASRTPRAPRAP